MQGEKGDIFIVHQNSKWCIESKKIQFCWEKVMETGVAIKLIKNQPLVFFSYGEHSGAISWQVRKQQTVALSSCEAEYQGIAAAVHEIMFLQQLLCGLQLSTSLGEDNQSAIKFSTNPAFHKRSKHIDVKQSFLRDAARKDEINILHVPTQKMAADIFTSGLCEAKCTEHCENIMSRLNSISAQVWVGLLIAWTRFGHHNQMQISLLITWLRTYLSYNVYYWEAKLHISDEVINYMITYLHCN